MGHYASEMGYGEDTAPTKHELRVKALQKQLEDMPLGLFKVKDLGLLLKFGMHVPNPYTKHPSDPEESDVLKLEKLLRNLPKK